MSSTSNDNPVELEQVLDRFEEAWQSGPRPALTDYLPPGEQRELLVELVHVDLERRLKAGEPARVEDYLARHPELTRDRQVVLELLAAEFQYRRLREPTLSLDEYAHRFPEHRDELFTLVRPAVGSPSTRLYETNGVATVHDQPASIPGEEVATTSRYRVLQRHARGGLGEIVLALDQGLQREVALKLLQKGQAQSPESRNRFLWEAKITGQLEHPGVVPLYGFGQAADGSPLYAMRFIRGESLQEAIRHFHEAEHGLFLRQLLGRFVDVCNTIAYAHSRGVIHRDLKPANVMLGEYGETLVVDWGLAKTVGTPDRDAGPITSGESPSGEATRLGTVIGTPAYMSPEQAAGRWDEVGPASDVYSLGATLYAVLTGQPPFQERRVETLLEQVQRGEFPPPCRVRNDVSPALEAICLKAMARRPADRYPDALALASDIEQWLADEPVSAYREPARERLRRWLMRHTSLVSGSAVALVAGAVLAVVTVLLSAARERERSAKELVELRSAEDRRNLDQADRDFYFHRIAVADHEWWGNNIDLAEQRLDECRREDLRRWEWNYLKRRCQTSLRILTNHKQEVWSVAYSPDGRRLASASVDGTVRLWDAETGEQLASFEKHTGSVWGLAFHPDGRHVAFGGVNGTVRLWDTQTGAEVRTFVVPDGEVHALAFSPDGKLLAMARVPAFDRRVPLPAEGEVKLWETATGKVWRTLQGHTRGVHGLAFSPDGKHLCSASFDSSLKVWDVETGSEQRTLTGHRGAVFGVAYSRDGTLIASAGSDGTARLWDAGTGLPQRVLTGHGREVWGVAFHPDGRQLATSSDDTTIRTWDVALGRPILVLHGHRHGIANVAYSPDGTRLASASDDHTIRIWDPSQRRDDRFLCGHTARVNSLAFHPDNRRFASTGEDQTVRVWEPATGRLLQTLNVPMKCTDVAFSPDGRLLAASNHDGAVLLWDTNTWEPLPTLKGTGGTAHCLAFSPDGGRLAAASADGTIAIWDLTAGSQLRTLRGHVEVVHSVVFSRDGGRLFSGGADKTVRVWDAFTGRELRVLSGHTTAVLALAISPDGQRLASSSAHCEGVFTREPGDVRLWDVETGQELRLLRGQWGDAPSMAFSPEWGDVVRVAFSPDGSRLVAAFADGHLKLWEPATGQEVLTLHDYQGTATCVCFSPDGRWLVSAGSNGNIRVRNGSPPE